MSTITQQPPDLGFSPASLSRATANRGSAQTFTRPIGFSAIRDWPSPWKALPACEPLLLALVHIPCLGSIPAGPAEQRVQEDQGCLVEQLEALGIQRATMRTFALRVQGDAMIDRHILEGDVLILEHGLKPRQGDIVGVLLDNLNLVGTLVIDQGKLWLKAENSHCPKLLPADGLVITGVMVTLIRKAHS